MINDILCLTILQNLKKKIRKLIIPIVQNTKQKNKKQKQNKNSKVPKQQQNMSIKMAAQHDQLRIVTNIPTKFEHPLSGFR